ASERKDVREVERDPMCRTLDDERIRNALLPYEERHEIAECAASCDCRTEDRNTRRYARDEDDQTEDDARDRECSEARARVVIVRGRRQLVRDVDRGEDERNR